MTRPPPRQRNRGSSKVQFSAYVFVGPTVAGAGRLRKVCASCHQLYGYGGEIGPDLTGAGRDNLDYLLENIVDPSASVSADFRMVVVAMNDGRT